MKKLRDEKTFIIKQQLSLENHFIYLLNIFGLWKNLRVSFFQMVALSFFFCLHSALNSDLCLEKNFWMKFQAFYSKNNEIEGDIFF